jgi:hypothetical protein
MFLRTANHVIAAAMVLGLVACSAPAAAPGPQQATLIEAAVESLKRGDLALSSRNFAHASAVFEEAIRAVGYSHYSADVADDTGTALTLAAVEDSRGNHEVAANLRRNVLSDRLTLLRRKSRGS